MNQRPKLTTAKEQGGEGINSRRLVGISELTAPTIGPALLAESFLADRASTIGRVQQVRGRFFVRGDGLERTSRAGQGPAQGSLGGPPPNQALQ